MVPTATSSRRLSLDRPGRAGDDTDNDGYGGSDTTTGTGDPTVVGPTIRKRTLTSTIHIEHDRIAVIGYDTGPVVADTVTGTPFFKDIPIIGWLFKSTRHRELSNHLLITVAAWRDDSEVRALAEALRRALAPRVAERVPKL